MPSAASRILRACREASRAAGSAASAASRCAAVVARSGSGGAAALDPSLRSPSLSRLSFRRGRFPTAARSSTIAAPATNVQGPEPGKVTFVAEDKDLESDEALWTLYERWCEDFNQERDYNEMASRFSYFKDTVLLVHETNKADLPYKLGINELADGKLAELMRPKVPFKQFVRRRPCSVVSETSGDTLCKKDLQGHQLENSNQSA
ncbi:hypothetical protein ACQ4PT_011976 [Festuca glaucescens]